MPELVGKPLFTFVEDSTRMSVEEFAKAHGRGFFVLVTNKPSRSEVHGKTEWSPVTAKPKGDISEEKTGDTGVYVLPLVRKATNSSAVLRVGRGASCDIVISDVTISKLHAFINEHDGKFDVLDAGSRNGTFVGDTEVAARGTGNATPLTSSARVRFGSISVTFLDAAALHNSAKARAR